MKYSRFRVHTLPWILYFCGTVSTLAAIISRVILYPDILSIPGTLAICALGFAAGFLMIIPIVKKKIPNRDFFNLKGTMAFCWVACILLTLMIFELTWTYFIAVPASMAAISFYLVYIPAYIRLMEEIKARQENASR